MGKPSFVVCTSSLREKSFSFCNYFTTKSRQLFYQLSPKTTILLALILSSYHAEIKDSNACVKITPKLCLYLFAGRERCDDDHNMCSAMGEAVFILRRDSTVA
ncbi:hypothetical protein Y032_0010g1106 [Ancylostoma ceylanicum]|nr:hypothetical protein Y032_0010g1106 [Ancylostoma ceylanicum]